MDIIEQILTTEEFTKQPPILLDIGASGEIHPKWKLVAQNSICIAFDADSREIGYLEKETSVYRKLYVYNFIVSDSKNLELPFYLTKSPYCSSLLEPDQNSLKDYAFASLFEVEKKVQVRSIELRTALEQLNINYVDWFKTDSQGTDLRLFLNLGDEIIEKILVAEFEPGIIDAYRGEDKLYAVMKCLESKGFWMSEINIKGSQRINYQNLDQYFSSFEKEYLQEIHRGSPGWGEVTFFKRSYQSLGKRDLLLFWIFSIIEKQYGLALEVASQGKTLYLDSIFDQMIQYSLESFRKSYSSKVPKLLVKKILSKLLYRLYKLLKK